MQIDWWTFALQTVNFLLLVWLLRRFLYRPVKEVIEKRKRQTEQAFAEAAGKAAEAEAARQGFEDARAGLAQERQTMLKEMHEELEADRRKVLDEARRESEGLLDAARQSLDVERKAALAELREHVVDLANELAANLLRTAGVKAPSEIFLEPLVTQLEESPTAERERLQKDLAADGARLTVVTAAPLTPEERERWSDRLGACLGRGDKTEFTVDPEILGGAELRFPHAILKLTWADQLREARKLLRADETTS